MYFAIEWVTFPLYVSANECGFKNMNATQHNTTHNVVYAMLVALLFFVSVYSIRANESLSLVFSGYFSGWQNVGANNATNGSSTKYRLNV